MNLPRRGRRNRPAQQLGRTATGRAHRRRGGNSGVPCRFDPGPSGRGPLQAALTELKNLPTSSLRRLLSPDSDCAADRTCEEAEPVSLAPRCTSVMLDETCRVPSAACCTLREISWVAAPCSSTAAAMAEEISDSLSMVPLISLIALDRLLRRRLDAADLLADLAGRLRGLLGQRLHLGCHHGKAATCLAGARRLDGGVERQQIGLSGDGIDQFDNVADAACCLRQFADAVVGLARLIDGAACHPRRFRTCRLISLTDEAISSVAEATDCTLVEASSEAAATTVVNSRERSAVAVSVPAEASSCVEAEDTVLTISPIIASNSRVILSTRRPRSILASASRAAASSAAFFAISASLLEHLQRVRHQTDLGFLTPMRNLRGRVFLAQCLHRRDNGGDAAQDIANQIEADGDADDDGEAGYRGQHPEGGT